MALNLFYIGEIQNAPLDESVESIADRLGVSRAAVKHYRKEAREQRQEVARNHIAAEVGVAVPGALSNLAELRRRAMADYHAYGDPKVGALALAAIEATMRHVRPDEGDEWRDMSDEDLEHYARTGRLPEVAGSSPAGVASA